MSTKLLKKKAPTKSKKNKERYYVNGGEFKAAIIEFYAEDTDIIPDQLAIYIKKIADGLSTTHQPVVIHSPISLQLLSTHSSTG